jgi:hypothetical protein
MSPVVLKAEIATESLETYKQPGTEQFLSESTHARGGTLSFEIRIFLNSIWN